MSTETAIHKADLLLAQYDEGHHIERPADHLAAAVAVVRELRVALADYEADAIHTCGPECRRPLCVLRAELNAEQQKYADLFQAMQHPSYEEENRLRAELEASRAELADAIATEELHAAHDKAIIDRLQGELAALRAQEPVAWGITDKNKAVSLTFSKGFANHWKEDYPTLKVYDFYAAAPAPAAVPCHTCEELRDNLADALGGRLHSVDEKSQIIENLLDMIGRISDACGISAEDQSVASGDEEILFAIEELKAAATAPAPAAVPEAVARDAARYRYLAEKCSSHDEQHTGGWSIFIRGIPPRRHDCEDAMDEAIDAALLAATQKQTTNAPAKASEDRSYLRPAVAQFAHRMEDVLRKNDHKGGWERLDQGWLYVRLLEEARELEAAIRYGGNRNTKHDAAILVANEAADVANFAMMIASNALLAAAQSATQEKKP